MEIGMTMVRLKRSIILGALALSLSCATLLAQGSHGAPNAAEYRPDYPSMRREIQGFETVMDKTIRAIFGGSKLPVTAKPMGVYLSGYGVAFSYTVNVYRGALSTPFGAVQGEEFTPEQKRRLIEDVKENLSKVLFENGVSLRQIRGDDAITIVGFFEDRNFPEERNQIKTVVMSILKKDLDEASRAEDRWKEFKMRMKAVEY
jgi:hypothetical protein